MKFNDTTTCSDTSRIDYYIVGTLANIIPGKYYQVSWDYALSEHWDHVRWKFSYASMMGTRVV